MPRVNEIYVGEYRITHPSCGPDRTGNREQHTRKPSAPHHYAGTEGPYLPGTLQVEFAVLDSGDERLPLAVRVVDDSGIGTLGVPYLHPVLDTAKLNTVRLLPAERRFTPFTEGVVHCHYVISIFSMMLAMNLTVLSGFIATWSRLASAF